MSLVHLRPPRVTHSLLLLLPFLSEVRLAVRSGRSSLLGSRLQERAVFSLVCFPINTAKDRAGWADATQLAGGGAAAGVATTVG